MIHRFEDPLLLISLAVLPLLIWRRRRRSRAMRASLLHPSLSDLAEAQRGGRRWPRRVPPVLRALAFVGLILALARPQTGVTGENVVAEGIDVVLVLDVSSSMLAEDLEPNRLEAAKAVAADFAAGRANDRIGLVVFAGKAFTQTPLTLDRSVLASMLAELEVGMIEDGTAVGMGLATAVKRLEASDAESKVAVLLTDGRNNRGEIDPVTAAQAAAALGVRVYAIGAGSRGVARLPATDRFGIRRYVTTQVDVDEPTLRRAAEVTGGRYFRATDRASLAAIYEEIDQLETTEIEVERFTRYGELFHIPLGVALALLVVDVVLRLTWLRTLP